MEKETIYRAIAGQIKEVYGVKNLNPQVNINSFNASSEDNDEFLRRFQTEFQVDMSGFNYYDFFKEDQLYSLVIVKLVMRTFRREKKEKLLTVEHLVNVAQNRKWSPPF